MGVFRKLVDEAQQLDDRLSDSPHLYRAKHMLDAVMPVALLVLVAVLYLEFFGNLSSEQHAQALLVQKLLLGYFVLEILVDFAIYEDNREFLRHKWLDIVLVLPFLTLFKGVGGVLKALKGVKAGKAAKPAKAAKTGKAAKAGKAGAAAKPMKGSKALKQVKTVQHVGKAVAKAKKLVRKHLS